ncbi:hypothetical protein [Undibacterium sp. RuTC16W]|uniref:hypothetical protein n=1 Tax=Undibacterium sp. RuTC16W TaxID=3413048 RepID=UPI003BF45CC9
MTGMKARQNHFLFTTELHLGHFDPHPYKCVPMPLNVKVPPGDSSIVSSRQSLQKFGCLNISRHTLLQKLLPLSFFPPKRMVDEQDAQLVAMIFPSALTFETRGVTRLAGARPLD